MEIIDIHAHVYRQYAALPTAAMTSQPLGRVKVGNEIRQFLPPSFHDTTSTVETAHRLYGLVRNFPRGADGKSILRLSQ